MPAAVGFYLIAFWLLAPNDMIAVGMITVASVPFYCAINTYRALFVATLTMEREMLAEFMSVVSMLPMTFLVIELDAGLLGLAWSIFAARGVFLVGCILLTPSLHVSLSGYCGGRH